MKHSILLSSAALLTVLFVHDAKAQLNIPSLGQCYANVTDKASGDYCKALESCVNNQSDDQASLQGCLDEAQDLYVAENFGESNEDMPMGEAFGAEIAGEERGIYTEAANSDLVESIQGDKGFTQQQEGPNVPVT